MHSTVLLVPWWLWFSAKSGGNCRVLEESLLPNSRGKSKALPLGPLWLSSSTPDHRKPSHIIKPGYSALPGSHKITEPQLYCELLAWSDFPWPSWPEPYECYLIPKNSLEPLNREPFVPETQNLFVIDPDGTGEPQPPEPHPQEVRTRLLGQMPGCESSFTWFLSVCLLCYMVHPSSLSTLPVCTGFRSHYK